MHKRTLSRHSGQKNGGSAIITVVVSMLFVMALGAALLFTTYTGYSIEITQRGDKENFYEADSAMDDMRLGVQTLLSEAVAQAYTDALASYTTTIAAGVDPQTAFNDNITAQLLLKTTSGGVAYFISSTVSGKTVISGYNAAALRTFIDSAVLADTSITVSVSGSTAARSSSEAGVLESVSLKSVGVQYIQSGYESNITSDIVIAMPNFFANSSVASSINKYAIIAHNSVIHNSGGPSTVAGGSVFSGSGGVVVSGSGNTLTFSGGDLICKGTILVDNSAVLSFNATDNELWTNEIQVGGKETGPGTATLDGNVFVADDLSLNGTGASVTLRNTYFGFGNSFSSSKESSSIVINGRSSTLDISQLNSLSLAGVSFINFGTSGTETDTYSIPMGESLSIKTDQLAYLVPLKCITNFASNPCVFDNNATFSPTIDMNTVLWGTGANAKKLSDYIGGAKGSIQTLYKPLGDNANNIVYVFLVFSDKQYANAYFQDYFTADKSKISQYMSLYVNSFDKATETDTAGNTYYTPSGGTLTLNPASDTVYAAGAQLLYSKMQSPYLVFVNDAEMDTLAAETQKTLQFKNASNQVVAVVSAEGDFPYSFAYDPSKTVRLIISSQDVTVNDKYTGIIIAGHDVILKSDVSGQALDATILDATCTANGKTYTLADFINNSAQFGGDSKTKEDLWNLDSLVYYKNWTKH